LKYRYHFNATIALHIRTDGFTLLELIIVVCILGTLAGISAPAFTKFRGKSKVTTAKHDIKSIELEIQTFYLEHKRYPESLAEIGLGGFKDPYGNPYQYMSAPSDDEEETEDEEKGKGKGKDKDKVEKKESKKDKMRKDRNLHPVNTDFDLYSMGEDGKSVAPFTAKPSQDDIVRANNGQFLGLVSEY